MGELLDKCGNVVGGSQDQEKVPRTAAIRISELLQECGYEYPHPRMSINQALSVVQSSLEKIVSEIFVYKEFIKELPKDLTEDFCKDLHLESGIKTLCRIFDVPRKGLLEFYKAYKEEMPSASDSQFIAIMRDRLTRTDEAGRQKIRDDFLEDGQINDA